MSSGLFSGWGLQNYVGLDPTVFPAGCHVHIFLRDDGPQCGNILAGDHEHIYIKDFRRGLTVAIRRDATTRIVRADDCDGKHCLRYEEEDDGEEGNGDGGDGGDDGFPAPTTPPQSPLLVTG